MTPSVQGESRSRCELSSAYRACPKPISIRWFSQTGDTRLRHFFSAQQVDICAREHLCGLFPPATVLCLNRSGGEAGCESAGSVPKLVSLLKVYFGPSLHKSLGP